jgi:hypothetical protein
MTSRDKLGISIVIMAHERQMETIRAVNAILRVDFGCDTEIVVSDNASNLNNSIKNLPAAVVHKIRNPPGNSLWHWNQILQELDHEWTLVTHDDDEILPRLGDLFQRYSSDPDVVMITGKSKILVNDTESQDPGYLNRLEKAHLIDTEPVIRTDLFDSLFDIGPLFPASAMIVRTSYLKSRSTINPDFDLASDLAFSMAIAKDSKVVFDGGSHVMNYHIHGGNSVFTTRAAGGLMADFTIVRLSEAVRNKIVITKIRRKKLLKSILVSRVLSKAFHLDERYSNIVAYAEEFNRTFPEKRFNRLILLPLPLGPLKIIVRRLMWKRLGVKRWGY